MDPDVVDEWMRVSDRDSFLTARRLAREEGMLAGGSGGTTVWAALEVARRLGPEARVLTMIPDAGRSYLSKFYDDNWMLEHGFLERRAPAPTVARGAAARSAARRPTCPQLVTIAAHQKVGEAIDVMQRYSISQLPGRARRRRRLARGRDRLAPGPRPPRPRLQEPRRAARGRRDGDAAAARGGRRRASRWTRCSPTLTGRTNAVVVARDGRPVGVLTRSDLLEYLAHNRG